MLDAFSVFGILLVNITNALLNYLLYCGFKSCKVVWWKVIVFVTIISSYMVFSDAVITEPYRMLVSLVISFLLLSLLVENKRIANFAMILTSNIIVFSIYLFSILIVNLFTYITMPFLEVGVRTLIVVPIHLLFGLFVYSKIKSKSSFHILKQIEIQTISYILYVVYLTFQFYLKYKLELVGLSDSAKLDKEVFSILSYTIVLGLLAICFFQIKRYRERRKLEEKFEALEAKVVNLEQINEDIYAQRHTDVSVIPTILQTFNDTFAEMTSKERVKIAGKYRDKLIELHNIYQNDKKQNIKKEQRNARLPNTSWSILNNYLKECNEKAIENIVRFEPLVFEDVSYLDKINISQIDVLKVLSDNINNSFKAIEKLNGKQGLIKVSFYLVDNAYQIEIKDNAPAFPIDILANVGERGVTRGGTGHGIANTLETLSGYNASLIIKEYAPENECIYNKAIVISFDGLNQFKVESYRAEEIKSKQGKSKAIIEYAEKKTDDVSHKYEYFINVIDALQNNETKEKVDA